MRLVNLFLYTLCGTLLLCTPFAIDRTLVNGIVMGKLFWAQGIISLLAVATIFAVLSRDDKPSFSFRREDALPLLIAGWNLAIYPWGLNPEPQKLLFGGGLLALWFLLRSLLQRYPWLKGYLLFALVLTGIAEAIEGIQQLEGYAYSNHSLFPLTGTFFNPGPYSGYLAIILPIGLDLFLRKSLPTPIRYTGAAYALLCLIVLPAGMSRSAWIAACIACAWVYLAHRLDWERLNRWQKRHRFITILALIIGCGLLGIGGYRLYSLKKDSADGRVLLWKITTRAIAEKPVQGTGLGGFPHAYAEAQAEYMASGKASEQEKRIAGCPEYAFNEYLHIGTEQGIIGLTLFIAWLGIWLYKSLRHRRYACAGALIAFYLFAFASYPLRLPEFWIVLIILGVIATSEVSPIKGNFPKHPEGYKRLFLTAFALLGITCFLGQKAYYKAYQNWSRARMYYNNKAYESALPEYQSLYPLLSHKPEFLFEIAQCLGQTGQYERANACLIRAIKLSADPMLYYVLAKNEQALKQYPEAEEHLTHAIDILPERIYPYYLLAHLYAEPDFFHPEKLREASDSVLRKVPKIESPAIREMREKVRKICPDHAPTSSHNLLL